MQSLGLIVAIANNNVIGTETNELPWHYPEDMKHFKDTTMRHPLIMGRKTYESLPEKFRPLPKRHNIVLSHSLISSSINGETQLSFAQSLSDALLLAGTGLYKDAMPIVMGGAQIYNLFLPCVTKMWITHIKKDYDGSVHMMIDYKDWEKTESKDFGEFEIATYDLVGTK